MKLDNLTQDPVVIPAHPGWSVAWPTGDHATLDPILAWAVIKISENSDNRYSRPRHSTFDTAVYPITLDGLEDGAGFGFKDPLGQFHAGPDGEILATETEFLEWWENNKRKTG